MVDKSLGQHWLKNRVILDEIAGLSGESDLCVEIGPGLGTLTSSLFKKHKKIIAVEFDKKLADNLPGSFPGKNLEVINGDILKYDFSKIGEPYDVVGNIPYYITSPIIEKVLTATPLPTKTVLLMQKEVAERVTSDKETVLSLFVKNHAKAELGPVVKAEEFTPPPKVDSQVLVLEPYPSGPKFDEKVFKLIKIGFSSPRKKLMRNLMGLKSRDELIKIFEELKIDLDVRPADVCLEDWYNMYNKIFN